jgi:hypothetical protein
MMNAQDRTELNEILDVIAPVFGQLIKTAMLDALRQHDSEQAVQVSCDQDPVKINFEQLVKDVGLKPLGEEPKAKEQVPKFELRDPAGRPIPQNYTMHMTAKRVSDTHSVCDGKSGVLRDEYGNFVCEFENGRVVPQVAGEREVWARTYVARFHDWLPEYQALSEAGEVVPFDLKHKNAIAAADTAVKAFRERYK